MRAVIATKIAKKRPGTISPGLKYVNVPVPEWLHESVRTIARLRCGEKQEHVKVCTVYREALEQYVRHPRQKRLLALRESA